MSFVLVSNDAIEYDIEIKIINGTTSFKVEMNRSPMIFEEITTSGIKKDDGSIIIISIPDWGYTPFAESVEMSDISEKIDLFNSSLIKFAATNDLKYVDVTEISRRAINEPNLITEDNLHPSETMYLEWANKIYNIWID